MAECGSFSWATPTSTSSTVASDSSPISRLAPYSRKSASFNAWIFIVKFMAFCHFFLLWSGSLPGPLATSRSLSTVLVNAEKSTSFEFAFSKVRETSGSRRSSRIILEDQLPISEPTATGFGRISEMDASQLPVRIYLLKSARRSLREFLPAASVDGGGGHGKKPFLSRSRLLAEQKKAETSKVQEKKTSSATSSSDNGKERKKKAEELRKEVELRKKEEEKNRWTMEQEARIEAEVKKKEEEEEKKTKEIEEKNEEETRKEEADEERRTKELEMREEEATRKKEQEEARKTKNEAHH